MYTDSTDSTIYEVQVFEGLDFAFGRDDQPLHARVTVPIVFSYLAESSSRTADLLISAGDATLSRKDRIDVTDTAGTTSFNDELVSADGDSWDAMTKAITIPAGVSSTTVQLFSEPFGQNPDSLLWEVGALRIPVEAETNPDIEICTVVTLNPDMVSGLSDADTITGDGCDALFPNQTSPTGLVGINGGFYQLKVTNIGDETLTNLEITSSAFGLSMQPIPTACGTLDPGEMCTIDKNDANFGTLQMLGVCSAPGQVSKLAGIAGKGITSNITVSDDDPAVVLCEDEIVEPKSCDDGKPIKLVFEYTGQYCTNSNPQGGKFTCSGDPAAAEPVQLVVEDANPNLPGETIALNGLVSITPSGDKLDSQTDFEIKQGGFVLQDLSIHLSCSKDLIVADRFGSLTFRVSCPV